MRPAPAAPGGRPGSVKEATRLSSGLPPEGGQRARILSLMDRIADIEREILAVPGDDESIPTPTARFRAEADEAANLLRMGRERLRRAVGGRIGLR